MKLWAGQQADELSGPCLDLEDWAEPAILLDWKAVLCRGC